MTRSREEVALGTLPADREVGHLLRALRQPSWPARHGRRSRRAALAMAAVRGEWALVDTGPDRLTLPELSGGGRKVGTVAAHSRASAIEQ
jgi:hypothetical protein